MRFDGSINARSLGGWSVKSDVPSRADSIAKRTCPAWVASLAWIAASMAVVLFFVVGGTGVIDAAMAAAKSFKL